MQEIEDVVLKKGDIVYFADGHNVVVDTDCFDSKTLPRIITHIEYKPSYGGVVKVERPIQFKTIYEAPRQMLDKQEKEWLENLLSPFRKRIAYICKTKSVFEKKVFIFIQLDDDKFYLPHFNPKAMYRGLKLNKEYTLKELGLFEGELDE